MNPIRILIFPCGAANALELHDALAHCVNIEVWGASGQDDHGQYVYRNYIGKVPYIQDPNFLPALNGIIERCRIDVVFPTHDTVAQFFANHRSEIACRVVMADEETARICREKRRIHECFADCSFAPRTYSDASTVDVFPVFAKPNVGEGGRNTQIIHTAEEAVRALAGDLDLLLVEYLPGEEFTVDCFTDRHGKLRFIGPRERSRIFYGISVHSKAVPLTAEVGDIAAEINRRLRFRGLWFFQVKRASNGKLKLMEVSTRAAGTMCLYRHQGVNLPLLSVYDAMDLDVELLQNDFPIEVDRALFNRFRLGVEYDTIYLDFDDTLICRGEVNRDVLLLLYQAARQGKKVHLVT
ncbi:MAG: carbamoylphosphate synthase large subunit short form, partial [Verrucomicrobiales bacterium]|nr:carbamoylphosphate synthase large subunit short form [Verrucomicrobiales bacterium]